MGEGLHSHEPAVRASYLRALLSACDEFGPPAAEIRERLGDVHQTRIECSGPLAWLPIETDLALQRSLDAVLGVERTREFLLANLRELLAASLVQNLVATAVGLFGLDPGSFARMLPHAWGLLYRDAGRWSVVRRELMPLASSQRDRYWREVELRLGELPSACAGEEAWLTAVATVHHALLVLCGREGEVELCERKLEAPAEVVFRLAWKASSGPLRAR
ncbi:MAG TPA: hypothetical protein VM869_12280 [Enhygromyxa sp.]|nr:hypothetical protein [Enhygromyxa sp.]